MKPMFEVGQKVMIRPDLIEGGKFNKYYVNKTMAKMAGTIVTITACDLTIYTPELGIIDGYRYEIDEDVTLTNSYHYNWTADCFVRLEICPNPVELLEFL